MAKGMSKGKPQNKSQPMKCSCTHPYQDYLYGVGYRLHNSNAKGDNFSCTVCGAVKR